MTGNERWRTPAHMHHRANQEHSLHRESLGLMLPCIAPHDHTNIEGKRVKKGEATFGNQCAARIMTALIAAGLQIPKKMIGMTCGVHAAEDGHWVRAREAAQTLNVLANGGSLPGYKKMRRISREEVPNFFAKVPSLPGILYIPSYWRRTGESGTTGDHIDLWNGYRTPAKSLIQQFFTAGIMPNYRHAQELWFWEVDDVDPKTLQRRTEGDVQIRNAVTIAALKVMAESAQATDTSTGFGTFDDKTGTVVGADAHTAVERSAYTSVSAASSVADSSTAAESTSSPGEPIDSMRRKVTAGIIGAILAPQILASPASAQQRGRGRQTDSGSERQSQQRGRVQAFEQTINAKRAVLQSGTDDQVRSLLLEFPKVPHYESLHDIERRALFPNVYKGYLSPEEEREKGMLSFPVVPSSVVPASVYDRKTEIPSTSQLMNDKKIMLFDGSMIYANGIRVAKERRIAPPLYAYAVADGSDQKEAEIVGGQQVFALDRSLSGTVFDAAGIVPFNFERAESADGKWVSVCWMKNPQISEDNGFSNPRRLYWDPQIEGAFMYDLGRNASLKRYVERTLRESVKGTSATHNLNKEMMLAGLHNAKLVVMASDDVHFFESQMQQVGGAAILDRGESGEPHLVGQAMWRIDIPKPGGGFQVAFLVSGAEQTKRAVA
ncbi:MAG: hypothetical protein RI911_862 [Candidatus Parcubacteria bacterium]